MARARNIKPGFFQNDDIAGLHPLERLAFIGMWTIADFKGCIEYRPKMLKVQILPYDNCDMESITNNLEQAGFIRSYIVQGKRYLKIINFEKHQNPHKNERDAGSGIPDIHEQDEIVKENSTLSQDGTKPDFIGTARADSGFPLTDSGFPLTDSGFRIPDCGLPDSASLPSEAPAAKNARATRLPMDWEPSRENINWALSEQPSWDRTYALSVAESFRDYWCAKGGADARKADWDATWRNWVRREKPRAMPRAPNGLSRAGQETAEAAKRWLEKEEAKDRENAKLGS